MTTAFDAHPDPWFNLVPSPLAEFDEQGHWLRHNPAFAQLTGHAPQAGMHLSLLPAPMQRLLGWDSPWRCWACARAMPPCPRAPP